MLERLHHISIFIERKTQKSDSFVKIFLEENFCLSSVKEIEELNSQELLDGLDKNEEIIIFIKWVIELRLRA